jgi:hypothetical protein
MNVLAIYAVNEHINQMLLDADQARIARQLPRRPSLASRLAATARIAFTRPLPQARAAAA